VVGWLVGCWSVVDTDVFGVGIVFLMWSKTGDSTDCGNQNSTGTKTKTKKESLFFDLFLGFVHHGQHGQNKVGENIGVHTVRDVLLRHLGQPQFCLPPQRMVRRRRRRWWWWWLVVGGGWWLVVGGNR
jgi:hypothetical protein